MIRRRLSGSKAVVDQLPRHQEEGGVGDKHYDDDGDDGHGDGGDDGDVDVDCSSSFPIRGAIKNVFFRKVFPNMGGWGGWVPNPPNHPENRLFSPRISPFRDPKSHKDPGVGRWVHRFGKTFKKKKRFFFMAPVFMTSQR